jgi:hypothetical protein
MESIRDEDQFSDEEHKLRERYCQSYEHIDLKESDLSKFPGRTPRRSVISDIDEMPYEAKIRLAFARFDLRAAGKKIMGLYKDLDSSDGGRDFLNLRLDHYYKTKDGQIEKIKCSILDREKGYINEPGDLPWVLSYPPLCVATFHDIPSITDPPLPSSAEGPIMVYEEYTDIELAMVNKIINRLGHTLPTTAITIKKLRERSVSRPGLIPYCHKLYEGTQIGNLLKDHPKAGRAALSSMLMSFLMWGFRYYAFPRDKPTREFLIGSFIHCPRLKGVAFPKEDLAEKQFDLLVRYGIIKGLEGYTNKKQKLYYATQKYGAHEVPKAPRTNPREYYISKNK